jgi:hypothetical protein
MKLNFILAVCFSLQASIAFPADWPMANDPKFDTKVKNPMFEKAEGPFILLDAAHHNFHVTEGFIDPFTSLAEADGYQTIVGTSAFTAQFLQSFNIVMIITALPFKFTSKTEVTTETTYTGAEIEALYQWVSEGGSLLVFSEHAPFDQAINPLLKRFDRASAPLPIRCTTTNNWKGKAGSSFRAKMVFSTQTTRLLMAEMIRKPSTALFHLAAAL